MSKTANQGEIVIIDDTPENLRLLKDMLGNSGYKVRALPNGEMGVSACQAAAPDLVLLDVNMPGIDGYEAAALLKKDPRTKEVPIIFISALSNAEDKVRAFRAGGVDYVTKPFQVDEVLARVETHLSISRLRRQINDANVKLLEWNMRLGGASAPKEEATTPELPEPIATLFNISPESITAGDTAEAELRVLAIQGDAGIIEAAAKQFNAATATEIGGFAVLLTPEATDQIAPWFWQNHASAKLAVGIASGAGSLIVKSDGTLDFDSAATLAAVGALAGATATPTGSLSFVQA